MSTDQSQSGRLILKKKYWATVPGGGPGGTAVDVPLDPPETPLPQALQSPGVKTVEDARGVDARDFQAGGAWQGDGDGSHWSGH